MGTEAETLIQTILRSYTGVFTDYAYISEDTLAIRTGLTRQQIYNILVTLTKRRIVDYIPHKKTPYIIYTRERVEAQRIHLSPEIYEERKARYEARINSILDYVTNDTVCRSRMLLRYFGEKNEHNCGLCDVCLSKHHSGMKLGEFQEMENQIREQLETSPLSAATLLNRINGEREKAERVLSYLLSEEIIQSNDGILSL